MKNQSSPIIFICAGESSGDMHGAELVKNIQKLLPKSKLYGLGGKKMQKAGVNLLYNLVELAVVGLWEVVKNLPAFIKILNDTTEKIKNLKPDLIILIDNPGFNLRLAKRIKHLDIPIAYYISPQVWAWGGKRIKKMKTLIDKMLVFFKFEENLYKNNNIDCKFVGHPLTNIVKPRIDKKEFKEKFGLKAHNPIIGLLPGSRKKEIQRHLPTLIKTADKINKQCPETQFLIVKSDEIEKSFYYKFTRKSKITIKLIERCSYASINASDFCIVASGTATLETTILETPMVIIYKVAFLTWLILKPQVKLSYIGMPNVIAGEKIVPEFVQNNFKSNLISKTVCDYLNDEKKYKSLLENLRKVKCLLGSENASENAAKEIIKLVDSS